MPNLMVGQQSVGYRVETSVLAGGLTNEAPGIPVLFLHGTTQRNDAWDSVRAFLSAALDHAAVMPDFPGSGDSPIANQPLVLADLVAQSNAVMQTLGHTSYHVVGYSLGAVVAGSIAATYPHAVRSLTMLCGWATSDARQRLTFDLWKRLINTDVELFYRYVLVDGYGVSTLGAIEPMIDAAVSMAATTLAPGSPAHLDLDGQIDIAEQLSNVIAPTLIIGALYDRWVDVSHSHHMASLIRGSLVSELPYGHLAIQEGAGEIAELLADHLVRADREHAS